MIKRKELYSEDNSCKVFLVESDESLPEHEHNTKEIMFILEGEGTLEIINTGERRNFREGSVLEIKANTKHKLEINSKVKGIVIYAKV